ncbi:hypothetical protein PsYK624_149980 [Phanerochaete sordida]|uniref:Uncharacterized protein n=1 Tax=Phanerochaete sordida TaxID=48140 RepID=A0A9P3GNI5_9APHY|nr:hypothetical protein PsYK624_149980 [Phanerochaete sordida]
MSSVPSGRATGPRTTLRSTSSGTPELPPHGPLSVGRRHISPHCCTHLRRNFMCCPTSHGIVIDRAALVSYLERTDSVYAKPWVEIAPQDERALC